MLLALASAIFLGSESLGTRDHILLSQIWDFPFRRLLRLAGSRWRYSTPPPHGGYWSPSPSHIATDGQSVSKSWCRAPSGAHDQIFITTLTITILLCGAPSLTRGRVCLLHMLLALASAIFLGSESLEPRGTNCPAYNISARTTQKIPFHYCCAVVAVETCLFVKPLLNSGCCTAAYFAVVT
jgi:hypothetical protein